MNSIEKVKNKSIIQKAPFVCMECKTGYSLHLHHCLHGADRKKADTDGLFVLLCINCHRRLHDGDYSLDLKYKQLAEKSYLKTHTLQEFIERYHKNYL